MVQSRTLAVHTQDDRFHEIQLNGKQLVFLFMSVTIVSVVVFLLGVLVGRNVRSAQDLQRQAAVSTTEPTADHLPPGPPTAPVSMSGSRATPSATPGGGEGEGPVATTGPVPTGELRPDPPSAVRAAERKAGTATTSTPAVVSSPAAPKPAPIPVVPQAKPSPVPGAQAIAANTPRSASPVAAPATRTSAPPDGWVVQLAALNDRAEAEEIARRLVSKGYGAFVVAPASGNPTVYRVRVGTFKTKNEADMIGAKLKKEERFDPWITR